MSGLEIRRTFTQLAAGTVRSHRARFAVRSRSFGHQSAREDVEETPNIQRRTSNGRKACAMIFSLGVGRWALSVGRFLPCREHATAAHPNLHLPSAIQSLVHILPGAGD